MPGDKRDLFKCRKWNEMKFAVHFFEPGSEIMIHHLFDIYFLSCSVHIVNLERSPQSSTNNRTNFCGIYLDRFAPSQEATRRYLNMSLDHLGTGVTWWAKTEKPRNEERKQGTKIVWKMRAWVTVHWDPFVWLVFRRFFVFFAGN